MKSTRLPMLLLACTGWLASACLDSPTDFGRQLHAEEVADLYAAKVFQNADGESIPYRILTPTEDQLQSGQRFPLILFLHGAGERGQDNQKQLVHAAGDFADPLRRQSQPAIVVCPQCPSESQWVQTAWSDGSGKGTFPDQPSQPLRLALELVESLKSSMPVDADRVYVTGLSMGGYGSWFAGGYRPDLFAAMLPVCGGGDPDWANRYSGLPIWAFHGDRDTAVPVQRSREMIAALSIAGHSGELRYTEYPGVAHNSWSQTYARDDVHRWLLRQNLRSRSGAGQ